MTLMDTLNLDLLAVGKNKDMLDFQTVIHAKQRGLRAKFPSDCILRS